jgi:hypothetical protein
MFVASSFSLLFFPVSSLTGFDEQGVPEERFVGGVGAIVLGSLLQSKILAADEAKLRFVRPLPFPLPSLFPH